MKILIVDDEQLARDRLARMLNGLDDCEVVGQARNGAEALTASGELVPDLVLMDIRMPGMDGLEAARHLAALEAPPAVIFCTAYDEHALEAFDIQAVGYLLKPVRKEDVLAAIGKAQRVNRAQLAALTPAESQRRTHISARTRKGIELVPVDSVRYFQADQKYVTVRHGEGELIIDETLRDLEDEFAELFVRVHRNALAATRYIVGLDRAADGQYSIRLRDVDETLEISRRHVASVRRLVKNL